MIPNLSTRPVTAWVTMLVVTLHGAIAWAMVSMETPAPVITKNSPKVIHLELITPSSMPKKKPSSTPSLPNEQKIEPFIEIPSPSNLQQTKRIEKPETTQLLPEVVDPLKAEAEQKHSNRIKSNTVVKQNANLENEPENPSSEQSLTIVESKKIVNRSDKEKETEDDLSAMIRAVTAQFNRERAKQQQAAKNQANRKLIEKEQWRIQAANEEISKMLTLAAEQAKKQTADKMALDDNVDKKEEETAFLANDGSWMEAHEPITSIPALVWRSINKDLGDIFIVILELHVNTEGYVTEVQLLEPSGSPIIDAIATTQVRGGQLNPFIQNGAAVDAIVPMSLAYERP